MKITTVYFLLNSFFLSQCLSQYNKLVINSFPINCDVIINNSGQSKTPAIFDSLEMGNYLIEFFLRENQSKVKMIEQYLKTTIALEADDSTIVNANFSTGEISVNNFKKETVSKAIDYPGLRLITENYYEDLGFTLDSINYLQLNDSNWIISSYTFSLEYEIYTSEIECKSNLVSNEVKKALNTAKLNTKKDINICFKNITAKNIFNKQYTEIEDCKFIYKNHLNSINVYVKTKPETHSKILVKNLNTGKQTPFQISTTYPIEEIDIKNTPGIFLSHIVYDTIGENEYSKTFVFYDSVYIDKRNNGPYFIIKFDKYWWFARNLSVFSAVERKFFPKQSVSIGLDGIYEYNVKPGKYYSVPKEYKPGSSNLYSYKKAKEGCPDGWRLPTLNEWKELNIILQKQPNLNSTDSNKVLNKLVNGTKEQGLRFTIWGTGVFDGNNFYGKDSIALFWTSTPGNFGKEIAIGYSISSDSLIIEEFDKNYALTVRCIKEE